MSNLLAAELNTAFTVLNRNCFCGIEHFKNLFYKELDKGFKESDLLTLAWKVFQQVQADEKDATDKEVEEDTPDAIAVFRNTRDPEGYGPNKGRW